MSGGSHNLVHIRDAEDFLEASSKLEDVAHVASTLEGYGKEGAAALAATREVEKELHELLNYIQEHSATINQKLDDLYPVWCAIDYCGSGACNRDDVLSHLQVFAQQKNFTAPNGEGNGDT